LLKQRDIRQGERIGASLQGSGCVIAHRDAGFDIEDPYRESAYSICKPDFHAIVAEWLAFLERGGAAKTVVRRRYH
jgi:hypothetical protein